MNSGIYFESSPWWLLACAVLGVGYAALLYFREKKITDVAANRKWLLWSMAAFRALCVTVIAILLLAPFLKIRFTKEQKPVIAILQDNSESVRHSFKGNDSTDFENKLNALRDKLKGKFEVAAYSFGDKLSPEINFSFNDKSTNISQAIEEINERYFNRNLTGVILASDGIYNQGVNPVYAAAKTTCNIYTIALGDTTLQRDFKFGNVLFNKTTYLNEQLALRVSVEAANLQGNVAEFKVEELGEGTDKKLRYSKTISIASQQTIQTFDVLLPAEKIGVVHYRLTLSELPGEVTYRNNARDIYVEVLDGRQQILLVANAPHPDIAALKTAIESSKNFSVKVVNAEDFNEPLNAYSLVIAHQLPSQKNKATSLFEKVKQLNKPVLYVTGNQTQYGEWSKLQSAVNISASGDRYNEVGGLYNKNFSLFTVSQTTVDAISKFPPIAVAFGNFAVNPASQTLLFQRINNVSTDFPLITFFEAGETKVGVICGEGIWRWRLYDFIQNKSHNATNEIISKTVQFLCVKADKRPFRVSLPKTIFNDNEPITFDAQLLNANFELVNTPDVDIVLRNKEGNEYPYQFLRSENAYNLNAGNLPVGDYTYTAKTKLGNVAHNAGGKFAISPLQLEAMRTRADHEVLLQLAAQHNGKMFYQKNMETLADEILSSNSAKPILYDTYLTESAINLKWIFALILLLLSAEWFTRKYLGAY